LVADPLEIGLKFSLSAHRFNSSSPSFNRTSGHSRQGSKSLPDSIASGRTCINPVG
jgi:hypothetical protein